MYYYIKFKICQTMIKLNRLFTGLFLSAHLLVQSQIHEMNISTYKPGAPIQLTMYGLFFEDINYGADGRIVCRINQKPLFRIPLIFDGLANIRKARSKE